MMPEIPEGPYRNLIMVVVILLIVSGPFIGHLINRWNSKENSAIVRRKTDHDIRLEWEAMARDLRAELRAENDQLRKELKGLRDEIKDLHTEKANDRQEYEAQLHEMRHDLRVYEGRVLQLEAILRMGGIEIPPWTTHPATRLPQPGRVDLRRQVDTSAAEQDGEIMDEDDLA